MCCETKASLPRAKQTVMNLWAYTTFDAAARACIQSLTAGFRGHEAFYITGSDTAYDTPSLELDREQRGLYLNPNDILKSDTKLVGSA